MSAGKRVRGSALLLTLILSAVGGIGVMVFLNVVSQERSRTAKLVQRTKAQYMSSRVVMRVAAVVQLKPWSDRFFREAPIGFSSAAGLFKDSGADFAAGRLFYEGEIRQVSAHDKRWRVKLKVTYPSGSLTTADYSLSSCWDMKYSEGILGNLNRAHVLGMVESDDPSLNSDQLDEQMDLIRAEARAPSKDPQSVASGGQDWMNEIKDFESAIEGVQVALLAESPLDSVAVPDWVDGNRPPGSPDPLGPVRVALNEASAGLGQPTGSPEALPRPSPSPSPSASPSPTPLTPAKALAMADWIDAVTTRIQAKCDSLGISRNSQLGTYIAIHITESSWLVSMALRQFAEDGDSAASVQAQAESVRRCVMSLPAELRQGLPDCPL